MIFFFILLGCMNISICLIASWYQVTMQIVLELGNNKYFVNIIYVNLNWTGLHWRSDSCFALAIPFFCFNCEISVLRHHLAFGPWCQSLPNGDLKNTDEDAGRWPRKIALKIKFGKIILLPKFRRDFYY